ncbi:hypothetical protein GBA52_026465 [Prunus armeniaca]|nr:hypothetical protein GBA52_026465 [Prunus armeniaca]
MALSTQRASTSRTSTEWAPPHWKHDVFLSFRGEDTRSGFLSHLYHELQYWQAIKTFKDDRDLEIGATISPELLTAIEESHLAIIVLSPNYASSAWCLDELSKILECMQDTKRILPIFYHVDPSDVRNQRGSFAEAFTKHEEKFRVVNWWRAPLRKVANLFGWDSKHAEFSGGVEMVNRWRAALTKIANISGWDSKNYPSEAELIKHIVKCVFMKVHPTFMLSGSLDKLVGIDSALEQLHLHLAPKDNDVRFIGIWGMGGVGKTTLAKLVFQRISHHFELSWFLSNVREVSGKQGGLVNLQRQILFPILKENVAHVWDEGAGTFFTQNRLCNKKVLLVFDDVDQLNQLKTLAGKKDWFGVGSRIIITTRDERLLVEHGIAIRYKVEVLKDDEALELFSQNAFKKNQPEEGFLELSRCFVHYAKGLPLALTTLGSFLYARGQDTWKSTLDNLGKIHNPTIFHSLKVSYDGLEEIDKKIVLDVACFHKGKNKEQVIEILDSIYNISSRIRIDVLIEKSLLTIEKLRFCNNIVEMHDLIQEMAREIVHLESPKEPCQRSRLWHRDDISHVFMHNSGTGAIEGIGLHFPKLEEVHWNTEAFSKMHGLRLLQFDNAIVSSGPRDLPNSLRIIRWTWYPSKSLPSSFEPRFLVELDMRRSKLSHLWDGAKVLPKLKCMDLSYSDQLTSTPDFTGIPNLEILCLGYCTSLVEVHPSVAVLKKLKELELMCTDLNSLPSVVEMDSLEKFCLFGCSKVKNIRRFVEQLNDKLDSLRLHGILFVEQQIRPSIEHLVGLKELHLQGCTKINKMVVSSLNRFTSLETLDLSYCNIGEGAILDDIGCLSSLKYLHICGNDFVSLPSSIRFLSKLVFLGLAWCKRLERLPDLPLNIRGVDVDGCISLIASNWLKKNVFRLSCINCFKLVEEEDWINAIFEMIRTAAVEGMLLKNNGNSFAPVSCITCPVFGILEWFGNPSVGDSITVELPLPPHPSNSSDWVGIAVCVVFDSPSPAFLPGYENFKIEVRSSQRYLDVLRRRYSTKMIFSNNLWVFYLPRDHPSLTDASTSHRFSFETHYSSIKGLKELKTSSIIKECRARLVYKRDLEEFSRLTYCDEAGPIGSRGSASSDDDYEGGIGSAHDDDDHDEPVSKRLKKV